MLRSTSGHVVSGISTPSSSDISGSNDKGRGLVGGKGGTRIQSQSIMQVQQLEDDHVLHTQYWHHRIEISSRSLSSSHHRL